MEWPEQAYRALNLSSRLFLAPVSAFAIRRSDWVVKSNDLINARYDWTVLQQRMVLVMIAQLNLEDEDFGTQRVDVADLVERSGLAGKGYYERAAEAAAVLLDQKIFVKTDAGRWRGYNLLSYVEAHPGHILARFNPDMRPFLLQLRRRFTRYMLEHVLRFQSPYSVRIYEMAMQFADIGHRTLPLDDLRETLGVAEKYPRFFDFQRRVLDQAVKEIARYTDTVVTYDILRDGRKPTHVKLYVRPKAAAELPPPPKRRPKKSSSPTTTDTVVGEGPQQAFDFVLPPRPPNTREAATGAAFRAWWRQRSPAEQATLEAKAAERLDPFVRQMAASNPSSVAVQNSLRDELQALWREGA